MRGENPFSPPLAPVPAGGRPVAAGSGARPVGRVVPALVVAAVLAVAAFVLHYSLERRFDALKVFAQYDVLFNTDPNIRIDGFSHGWNFFNRNLLHPNLANFVNPPIRLVAEGMRLAGAVNGDPVPVRRQLGLLVGPLAAALNVAALFTLFCRLGLSLPRAGLLALAAAFSFTQLIFGSIPDHFILSGFVLTLIWLLAHHSLERRQTPLAAWFFLAWLAAGITLTNVAIVGIVYLVCLAMQEGRFRVPVLRTGGLVAAALAATWATHLLLSLGYDADAKPADSIVWSGHFLREEIPSTLADFPAALAGSIAPPSPETIPIQYRWPRGSRYEFQFTLADGPGLLARPSVVGFGILILAGLGAAAHIRVGGARRGLAIAALAVIAFNALFHACWGHEYFLYSQHWLAPLLFLLAGFAGAAPGTRQGEVVLALLTILPAAVALNNLLHLQEMLTLLASVH